MENKITQLTVLEFNTIHKKKKKKHFTEFLCSGWVHLALYIS